MNELIILSYHKFVTRPDTYRFSRTYEQFDHDIRKKIFDLITIDDGMLCQIEACRMLRVNNIRAKLFVCTSLIGTDGYCTWNDLRKLSEFHDIENHSHLHKDHSKESLAWQFDNMHKAHEMITNEIGKRPRFFVGPYNQYNTDTDNLCFQMQMIPLKNRINVLNISK